jgi:quercetin dioxygenase-like cupin family protein
LRESLSVNRQPDRSAAKKESAMNARRFTEGILALLMFIAAALSSTGVAAQEPRSAKTAGSEGIAALPDLTTTAAGEPLLYLSTPDPVISSDILTVPAGGVTQWMTHPVPAYLYVLEGDLTVEFIDGKRQTYHTGQAFLQSRTHWHRGRNDGTTPVRFLAVFLGAKGVPTILHPPAAQRN